MGDEVKFATGPNAGVQFPVECHIRLSGPGKSSARGAVKTWDFEVDAPGVYRVEGWLDVGGEGARGSIRIRSMCDSGERGTGISRIKSE